MEMPWGIIMSAFSLFGMLVLMIAAALMTDAPAGVAERHETGPATYPQPAGAATAHGTSDTAELKKAA